MKAWISFLVGTALFGAVQLAATETPALSAYERSQGWRLLFDGASLSDWRGYHENKFPANWQVVDGSLTGREGTALASEDNFQDFELLFDWKVTTGGHGEVYFHADDEIASPANSGPVMQLFGPGVAMAGNGGLNQPWREIVKQPDVWYRAKISVFGYQVDYWINGERVQSYLIDTPDWRAAVAASPFKAVRDYGLLPNGRIVLSGAGISFRNIKVRSL